MRRGRSIPHVKRVRAKGRSYHYFETGQMKPNGKPILIRLPDPAEKSFGATYAAHVSHRTRRSNITPVLMLDRFAELWQASPDYRKLKPSSREKYDISLRHLCHAFNTAEANLIERRDMVDLIDSMADRPGAANLVLKVTRSLYKWGRRRGHVDVDPCTEIPLFELGEYQPWPESLLQEALTADDARVRLATHLLYFTAQRIGDACRLRWSDISDGYLDLTQEKTGRELTIRVHQDLLAELARTPRVGLTILATPNGAQATQETVRDALRTFAAERGHRIVPHGLRKNAVNALIEAGNSVAETASVSGQSLKMVEHYAKGRNNKKLSSAAILKWQGAKS